MDGMTEGLEATGNGGLDPARVLAYWLQVEALTPYAAEEDHEEETKDRAVARHVPPRDWPWLDVEFAKPSTEHSHIVRLGIFGLPKYQADIVAALAVEAEPDRDIRPQPAKFGFSAAFVVDNDGKPVPQSLQVPASGMAFQNLVDGVTGDLDADLTSMRTELDEGFSALVAQYAEADKKVDTDFVSSLRALCALRMTWLDAHCSAMPLAVVRSSNTVWNETKSRPRMVDGVWKDVVSAKRRTHRPKPIMIESYYLADLREILHSIQDGQPGLVAPYIKGTQERVDCTTREFVRSNCTARTHPPARWPARHDLALMQQLSVDLISRRLDREGIFSINGPPGTGKTTLLMDIVADVVDRRAKAMCAFSSPADAFKSTLEFNEVDASLRDHLVVVASSNNGAVQNITQVLPNEDKVDLDLLGGFRFLQAAAQQMLDAALKDGDDGTEDSDTPDPEQDIVEADTARVLPTGARQEPKDKAWGLISAVMGKMENRRSYAATLDRTKWNEAAKRTMPVAGNVFDLLRSERENLSVGSWTHVRSGYLAARSTVEQLTAQIENLEEDPAPQAAALAQAVAEFDTSLADMSRKISAAAAALQQAQDETLLAIQAYEREDRSIGLLAQGKPSRLRRLLGPAAARSWDSAWTSAMSAHAAANARIGLSQAAVKTVSAALDAERASLERVQARRIAAADRIALEHKNRTALLDRHSGLVTAGQVATEADVDKRHLMLPGSSKLLREARGRLFVEAMRVHLAFAAAAGSRFETNLRAALQMLRGKGTPKGGGEHLWASLAIVTPVVSTTFASMARCFSDMGFASIPWLLIDEAGQAVPHNAVGAIWRARRAVVVGDPFQVMPVLGLDNNADAALARRHGVDAAVLASRASAQTLADRANSAGTTCSPMNTEPVWVGSPLKVHRRCVDPMFGISNRLAYEGSMVLPKDKIAEEAKLLRSQPLLGDSCWIDIEARSPGPKHYVPQQGDVACRIVLAALEQGFVDKNGLPKVYVISPFRSVADAVRKLLCSLLDARNAAPKAKVRAWGTASVGSVHTFQGKEMQTVVLLLGGATDGAVGWACQTPNILNVAVSRAQRRLYVVGERAQWLRASDLVAQMNTLPSVRLAEAEALMKLLQLPKIF